MAFFWNYGLLPPQYVSFDEGNPYPKKCCICSQRFSPFSSLCVFVARCPSKSDASDDPALYDEGVLPISPILCFDDYWQVCVWRCLFATYARKEASIKLPAVGV